MLIGAGENAELAAKVSAQSGAVKPDYSKIVNAEKAEAMAARLKNRTSNWIGKRTAKIS